MTWPHSKTVGSSLMVKITEDGLTRTEENVQ